MKDPKPEFDLFDRPATRKWLWRLLYASCLLTVLLEFLIDRHGHFEIDGIIGFYALLGFVGCTLMILAAKALGFVLKKNEDYYDDESA